jgi:amino acid permease
LTAFETYIALIKGYCVILILYMPGAFKMGGIIASPLLILASAFVTTVCVAKLVKVGLALDTFSYSRAVE